MFHVHQYVSQVSRETDFQCLGSAVQSKSLTWYALVFSDYAFSHRKFGGNAQSITKNRWVHHTSFLWDYDVKNMDYLKIPKRAPEYRLV
jgi:lipoate-protein ligase A